ncbi:MAG: hypothetical protein FI718_04815 [SAR202 cluster bacterium]|nr:hypothetical protein [SAR202 cluster bacterium]MQG39290.1 hypothetical protein [SAR202 cluster bacterium]|tara:strand:- start:13003 stop:13233 length:231 start_codon:yes stop_codon:yes gene_type:complete
MENVVELIRDVLLIILMITALILMLVVYFKISNILRSVRRTISALEKTTTTVSDKFIGKSGLSSKVVSVISKFVKL